MKLRDESAATIKGFSKNLQSIGVTGREVGESMQRMGLAIAAGAIAPLGLVIKAAKDFESAFANVVKTVEGFDVNAFGELNDGAQAFRDSLLDLSTEIPIVASDLANIAAIGGQFGIAQGDLLKFTEVVAKLGVAVDGIEAETAAAALAQISNVTGEGTAAIEKYANVLVDLGNKGNSTEADILEFAKRLAGAGHQAGLTGDQIFGLGAAMANVGLNAEAGGTAMSKLVGTMSKAGAEGAAASQKFADFAGLVDQSVASGEKFAELFEHDAAKALQLFFDGLSSAAASGQNLNVILSDLGVNERRQADTIMRLAGAHGEVGKQMRLAADAAREGTALNEEARKKFATFDNQLQLFLNSVRLVAIEIGTPLIASLRGAFTAMKPVTDQMITLARQFADLPPVVHQATLALGGGAGLAGILLIVGGSAARAASDIARLVTAIRGLTAGEAVASVAKAATGVQALGGAAASSTGGVMRMTAATNAWGYSMSVAAPQAETAAVAAKGFGTAAAAGVAGIVALGLAFAGAKHYVDEWLVSQGAAGAAARVVTDGFSGLLRVLRDADGLWAAVSAAASAAGSVLRDLGTILRDQIGAGLSAAQRQIQPLVDWFNNLKTSAANLGSSLVEKVNVGLTIFSEIVKRVVPGVQQMAGAVAFVTGTSAAWTKELHDWAEQIRVANGQIPPLAGHVKAVADQQVLAAAATVKNVDALAKSREELERLRAAVAALTPEQTKLIDGWRAAGASAEGIAGKTKIAEDVITAYIAAADKAATANKSLAKETAVTSEAFVQFAKEGVAAVQARLETLGALDAGIFDEITASSLELNKAMRTTADAIELRQTTLGLSKEYAALVVRTRAYTNELADLRHEADKADPALRSFYDRLIDLKTTDFAQEIEEGVVQTDEFKTVLLAVNPAMAMMVDLAGQTQETSAKANQASKDWTQSLSGLANAFGNLKDLGGAVGFAADFVVQADIALQSFGKVREGIKEFAKGAKADLVSAFADMAAGIGSGLAGVIGATDPSKDLGQRLLGGALQGASLGASVGATIGATIATSAAQGAAYGGAWGAAAGVIVGIMIAVFRGRKARREMEIVGAEWGTSISKGLYDAIDKSQKELFNGDRVTAALFNFKGILQEAGGLNALNFDQFTAKLRDVFVAIDSGKMTTQQALQVMAENFDAFAQHVIQSGEFASKGFLEILNLNIASGLNSPEIRAFIQGRSAVIGEGLAAMLGPVVEGAKQVGDRVRSAFKAVDDLIKGGKQGTDEYAAAVGELNEALRHQREVAAGAVGDLDNIGLVALSTFTRARASGLSFIEALNAIGPALDVLIQTQRDLGVEGTNAALNQLMHYRELAAQFPTLVAAASALGPTLLAIQQSGGLTVAALAAMEDQGMRTFNRLRDAGFTENEALAQMADFLKNVEKAHKLLGTPIDENTQRLLDQARAAGLLGDEAVDATTQQRRGFELVTKAINQLIITLGGVPIAIEDISNAINDIPKDVTVDVHFNPDDLPDFPDRGGPNGPTQDRPTEDPNYQGAAGPFDPALWDPTAMQAATASAVAQTQPEIVIEVPVDLDGETLTRVVARRLPEYTELYGGPSSRTTV